MQRKIISIQLVLIFLLGFSGCKAKVERLSVEKSAKKTTLVVACPKGVSQQVLENQGKVSANRLGIELQIISREAGNLPSAVDSNVDIWIIKSEEIGEFSQTKLLAFAPDSIMEPGDKINWSDFLPLYREKLLVWQRKIVGLPICGEAKVCLFREDLFNLPQHQQGFKNQFKTNLKAPSTWDDYFKIAQYFSQVGFNSSNSLAGLSSNDHDFEFEFLSYCAGFTRQPVSPSDKITPEIEDAVFSFLYDFRNGKPLINSSGFVKGLENFKLLQKFRSQQMESSSANAFLKGKAVLTITDANLASEGQSNTELKDKIGLCTLPGSDGYFLAGSNEFRPLPIGNKIPYLGTASSFGCVNLKSGLKELAFQFLLDLAGPEMGERIAVEPSIARYTRYSQLDKIRLDAMGFDSARTTNLRESIRANLSHVEIKNPALCSRLPGYLKRRRALVEEVRSFLIAPTGSAKETLDKVANRWIQIDKAWSEKEFQALVKLSVGLIAE